MVKAPVIEQCVLVLSKVRRWLTTFNLRRPRFDLYDGNPVGNCGREMAKNLPVEIQIETPQLRDKN
jgi:hypothetical protein